MSPLLKSLCVGWIDGCQLTREGFANAVPAIQPTLTIVPFTSINAYLSHPNVILDLVVYYVHDMRYDIVSEIRKVRKAAPNRSLLIISNLTEVNRDDVAKSSEDGIIVFLQPQNANLHLLVSTLYMIYHKRQSKCVDILRIAPSALG